MLSSRPRKIRYVLISREIDSNMNLHHQELNFSLQKLLNKLCLKFENLHFIVKISHLNFPPFGFSKQTHCNHFIFQQVFLFTGHFLTSYMKYKTSYFDNIQQFKTLLLILLFQWRDKIYFC